jgi:hypothetical protein
MVARLPAKLRAQPYVQEGISIKSPRKARRLNKRQADLDTADI